MVMRYVLCVLTYSYVCYAMPVLIYVMHCLAANFDEIKHVNIRVSCLDDRD